MPNKRNKGFRRQRKSGTQDQGQKISNRPSTRKQWSNEQMLTVLCKMVFLLTGQPTCIGFPDQPLKTALVDE